MDRYLDLYQKVHGRLPESPINDLYGQDDSPENIIMDLVDKEYEIRRNKSNKLSVAKWYVSNSSTTISSEWNHSLIYHWTARA